MERTRARGWLPSDCSQRIRPYRGPLAKGKNRTQHQRIGLKSEALGPELPRPARRTVERPPRSACRDPVPWPPWRWRSRRLRAFGHPSVGARARGREGVGPHRLHGGAAPREPPRPAGGGGWLLQPVGNSVSDRRLAGVPGRGAKPSRNNRVLPFSPSSSATMRSR